MAQHEVNLNELYQIIGGLVSDIKNVQKAVEKSETSAVKAADEATKSRAEMNARFDHVVSDVAQVKEDVAEMKSDVASAKEVTEEVKRWKLMGMGALGVTGIAAGAIGASLATWWDAIWTAIKGA